VALGLGDPVHSEERKWTFEFQPVHVQVYGHDPHVPTPHANDFDSSAPRDTKQDVLLTSQNTDDLTAAEDGPGGPIERVEAVKFAF
jgi:hypothetical protein